jgi:hypothetical protein
MTFEAIALACSPLSRLPLVKETDGRFFFRSYAAALAVAAR